MNGIPKSLQCKPISAMHLKKWKPKPLAHSFKPHMNVHKSTHPAANIGDDFSDY